MLAALLSAVRADLDRQVAWVGEEARRQIRYVAVIGAIAAMAALAALGTLIVGLVALHSWLTPQVGSLASLGVIGAFSAPRHRHVARGYPLAIVGYACAGCIAGMFAGRRLRAGPLKK